MKKLYIVLIALFTLITLPGLQTQAFDIPLNYGESDNDEAFVQTKNLFDINRDDTDYSRTVTNTTGTISIDLNTNTITTTTNAGTSGWIILYQLEPNTQYFISGTVVGDAAIRAVNVAFNAFLDNGAGLITTDGSGLTNIYFRHNTAGSATFTDVQLEVGSTATSYAPYGFLSLNNIFVDGQLLTNPDFNTTSNWSTNASTNTATDGILTNTGTGSTSSPFTEQNLSSNFANDTMYIMIRFKTLNDADKVSTNFYTGVNNAIDLILNPENNVWYNKSALTTNGAGTIYIQNIRHHYSSTALANGSELLIDYAYLYNLNNLGIDHLSKDYIDALFSDWQTNNIYNQGKLDSTAYAAGFAAGYTSGYNTGYSDAVTEDNAYSLGYALGLSEGQDMETGSSIIVLVLAALSFGFMIFGFSSRKRIFNLFAAGLFIALGGLMVEYAAFIIISIGFVIFNIWYTFASD